MLNDAPPYGLFLFVSGVLIWSLCRSVCRLVFVSVYLCVSVCLPCFVCAFV